jgi:hypothetical protein
MHWLKQLLPGASGPSLPHFQKPALILPLLSLLLAMELSACAPAAPATTPAPPETTPVVTPTSLPAANVALPASDAIADWKISTPVQTYTTDNLFDLVDGQSDGFFVYNFQQVTTQRYKNAEGTLLNVEVWQLAQPADAYGLFTQSRAGTPIALGNDGDTDPGRRLAFWQDRYYIHVNANKKVPEDQLMAFAQAVGGNLPTGGERPALVKNLPTQGLAERGFIFFHEELSMQGEVWLGGDNILGLSRATNGVVARYTLDGTPAHLLLIQYPGADQASTALQALRKAKDIELIVANSQGPFLGAVFGQASEAAGAPLLQAGLTGAQP